MSNVDAPTFPADSQAAAPRTTGAPTAPPEQEFQREQSEVGVPAIAPPGLEQELQIGDGVTAATWHVNKRVTRHFHNGNKNIWIALEGVGWRRLNSANESAGGAMSIIASHAVDNGLRVRAHESDSGLIDEIYCL